MVTLAAVTLVGCGGSSNTAVTGSSAGESVGASQQPIVPVPVEKDRLDTEGCLIVAKGGPVCPLDQGGRQVAVGSQVDGQIYLSIERASSFLRFTGTDGSTVMVAGSVALVPPDPALRVVVRTPQGSFVCLLEPAMLPAIAAVSCDAS